MPVIDFEFDIADDGADPMGADVIEHGVRRRVRRPKRAILALVIVGVVAVAVVVANRPPHRAPAAATTSASRSVSPAASAAPTAAQAALAQVVVLAESADPLRDDLLSDREIVCPAARSDASVAAAVNALQAAVPGFTLIDAASTRGAHGSLCGLVVRARDALSATVIMTVLAPPDASNASFEISHGNDRTTVVDVGVLRNGWSVQVGWLGQTGAEVTAAELRAAAQDQHLLW